MTYHPSDSDDDGTVEAEIDTTAVSTEQLDSVRYASAFDGADGGEQIQAAINDLPSKGGAVIVGPNGPDTNDQWLVSSKITFGKDNVTVRGAGMDATKLKLADGADVDIFDPADNSHITISDMEVDGNRRNQTIDSANHVSFVRTFDQVDFLTVERVHAYNFVNNIVNTEKPSSGYSTHVTVTDCYLDQQYDPAVDDPSTEYRPAEDVIEFKKTKYFTVSNCWISGAWKAGVEIERSKHGAVSGNVFEDTGYRDPSNAVILESADPGTGTVWAENVAVVGNAFHELPNHAISVNGGRRVTINNNTMQAVTDVGVELQENGGKPSNVIINGNSIMNPGNTSCVGVRGRDDIDGLLISGNQIRGGSFGMKLDGLTKGQITQNRIEETDSQGLQIDNGDGCAIVGNIIKNTGSHSIDLSAINGPTSNCQLFWNESNTPNNADLRLASGSDNTVVWFNFGFGNINDSAAGTDVRWNNGDDSATESNDSMTADPESATEDGYLELSIGGTAYQVPIYQG